MLNRFQICWAKRINFRNYILLAEDVHSYEILREVGEPVYISQNQSSRSSEKKESRYGSIEFQITMMYRVEFLMSILQYGVHFLTADMDSIWLDDPFKYVSRKLSITVQGQTHKETKMSGGFVLVHSTSQGKRFWKEIVKCQRENLELLHENDIKLQKRSPSDFTEQECINNRLNTTEIHLLDRYLFPDGRSFFDQHQPQQNGIVPVVIHGNWLIGLNNKLDRLKAWDLLATTNQTCPLISSDSIKVNGRPREQFRLRIRIMTYNRLDSLHRLLLSLAQANYTGDSVPLDICIDKPPPEASSDDYNKWAHLIMFVRNVISVSKESWYDFVFIHFLSCFLVT